MRRCCGLNLPSFCTIATGSGHSLELGTPCFSSTLLPASVEQFSCVHLPVVLCVETGHTFWLFVFVVGLSRYHESSFCSGGQCTRWPTAGSPGRDINTGSGSRGLEYSFACGSVRGFFFAGGTVHGFHFAFVPVSGFSFASGTVRGFLFAFVLVRGFSLVFQLFAGLYKVPVSTVCSVG